MESDLRMLKYYKSNILSLKNMLDGIDPSNDNAEPVLEVQKYILERILQTENSIYKTRNELKALKAVLRSGVNSKEYSKRLKSSISKINDSINGYKYLLYVWRCFGDGIVFKYISKWNLKRFLFEADSPEIKQTSGYIIGKEGIRLEWGIVVDAVKHGVPAILCDITNIIRHGDVCLLGASDPHVIEVKSSSNKNKRVDRQIKSINKIHHYLQNNIGPIGGVEVMSRVEILSDEKHHNWAINEVIQSLAKKESHKISPEPGLLYVGISAGSEPDFDALFSGVKEPIVYLLNQAKSERRWDNYYPFTLSIKDGESLYRFLKGDIYLIVIIDGAVLKKMFKNIGYSLNVVMSEDAGFIYSKKIEGFEDPVKWVASEHYIGRLGLEFMSLEWFVENEEFILKEIQGSRL